MSSCVAIHVLLRCGRVPDSVPFGIPDFLAMAVFENLSAFTSAIILIFVDRGSSCHTHFDVFEHSGQMGTAPKFVPTSSTFQF